MGKIILSSTQELRPAVLANEVWDGSVTIRRDKIHVALDWYYQPYEQIGTADPIATGDPVLVRNEGFDIVGTAFDQIKQATVATAHLGQTFFSLFTKGIRNKVKQIRSLDGTVEDD